MNAPAWSYLLIFGYAILLVSITLGIGLLIIKRRRERPPLEFKLLRGPGEFLRRKMQKDQEDLWSRLAAAMFAPLLVGFGVFYVLVRLAPKTSLWAGLTFV